MRFPSINILAAVILAWQQESVSAFQTPRPSIQKHLSVSTITTSLASSSLDESSSTTTSSSQIYHQDNLNNPISRRNVFSQASKTAALISASTATSSFHPLIAHAEGEGLQELTSSSSSSSSSSPVPTTKLGKSSLEVSRTIQGYWQLAGGHGKYNTDDAIQNMAAHYKAGITTLDTADIYGPSEQIMGKFIDNTTGAVPCTKFCCFRFLDEIDKNEVRTRIIKSCERLKVEKLPLVQFFWSNYGIKRYVDVALMLTELKEEGLIGEIGATNFDLPRLRELVDAGVPLVSHQVQLSCIDQRPVQSGMTDWCAENGVSTIAFGTVGSGILSEKYLGRGAPSQEEKNTSSMKMYSKTAERFGSWDLVQDLLKTMDAVASDVRSSGRSENANISNIAQRYVLDTNSVASVLVGVRNRNHIEENVRTHSFDLTQGERDAIASVIAKRKGPSGDVWDLERGNLPTGKK